MGQGHYTNINADEANTILGKILEESKNQFQEKIYIGRSVVAMRAALCNLQTIYDGRELNFKENGVLRKAHLASIERSIEFGKSLKDFGVLAVSGIISGTIALGGSLLIDKLLGVSFSSTDLFIISIIFGLFGFFLYWVMMKYGYKNQLKEYIKRDHERTLYYEQYLFRVRRQLIELYKELIIIHNEVFETDYTAETKRKDIETLIGVICPTWCKHVDKCICQYDLSSDEWVWCETGAVTPCPNRPPASEKPDTCKFRKPPSILKPLIAIAGSIAIVFILLAIFSSPVPVVKLDKSPAFQALYENQTVNVTISLMNLGDDTITQILIKDEVPAGFIIMAGSPTLPVNSLERGDTIFMNYTLRSVKTGSFDLPPAEAFYVDSHGVFHEIKSTVSRYMVLQDPAASLFPGKG